MYLAFQLLNLRIPHYRGIHGGLDAFLYTFHPRVASKNFFPYVAELDGTIVS